MCLDQTRAARCCSEELTLCCGEKGTDKQAEQYNTVDFWQSLPTSVFRENEVIQFVQLSN